MSISFNVNEKANLIWAIADKLTGVYKPHEYGEVILPLMVIRRFDCVLHKTKQKVLQENDNLKKKNAPSALKSINLYKASGYDFYNISKFSFESLIEAPDNIEANFHNYIQGFSENVRDIIEKFDFDEEIKRMANKDILYITLKEFCSPKADLHPDKISNLEMGYIFEEIVRRFSESHNEEAGQHYTPREVIELMTNILFLYDTDLLSKPSIIKTLYDPACGTGGMLSVAQSHLHKLNSKAKLIMFGQEINDTTFAICKADMLIKGNCADNIKDANTLSDDQFTQKFDYILSNPPFGREWENEKAVVEKESQLGFGGRFGAGLPSKGDSQMLFLQTAISKMNPQGARLAIIHNGSPLFTGDAGSGPCEIGKYILEQDLLEAIIALPNDLFYNTGIATYVWVLSNNKIKKRKGKVQLINANQLFEKRRKSLGHKRNDISPKQIEQIVEIYGDFKESQISKIFDNKDFGYYKVTVERPLKDKKGNPIYKPSKTTNTKQSNTPIADPSLRDHENIPLNQDIKEYFKKEVLPFAPDAWIDESKTKTGYEIPFTRYFYKYIPPKPSKEIIKEIEKIEKELKALTAEVFEK
jgi:type I restriction enzyme M protein